MWETLKSIAFVITTVMIALILQARADVFALQEEELPLQQLDFSNQLTLEE